jgi:hypothetical protein
MVCVINFSKRFAICFQVLPVMPPFNFGEEELNIDDSVSVTCSITKGDLPIQIWWTFLEQNSETNFAYNLSTNDGIVITKASPKISMLVFEAVKARHRGNYTCYAQNRAGLVSHSSFLTING